MPKVKTNFKAGQPRHFIRAWRKFRGLTIQQLADRVNVTHGAISQLERGEVGYTQAMLEAIAESLQVRPGDLVTRDPEIVAPTLYDQIQSLPAEAQASIETIVRQMRKAS